MSKHIVKYEYQDGVKLQHPLYWCGRSAKPFEWSFTDAQHAALSVGGSISPCKCCIKAIIKELEKEL